MSMKRKLPRRILSIILVMTLLVGLLAIQTGAATSNASLDSALANKGYSDSSPNPGVYVLDLSGENIYGDIDADELAYLFPDMSTLILKSTNVTRVANATNYPSLTIDTEDTFESNERYFQVTGNAVYRESDGDLTMATLLDAVKIRYKDGSTNDIPDGMLTAGTVTFDGTTYPLDPNDPSNDSIDSSLITSQGGTYTATLNFPVYNSSRSLSNTINLEILKSSYILSPNEVNIFDGGTATLTLTRTDEYGNSMLMGNVTDYDYNLFVSATHNLNITNPAPELINGGYGIRITVTAVDLETVLTGGSGSTSAVLYIYPTGTTTELASAKIVKQSNMHVTDITLKEYYYDSNGNRVIGDTVTPGNSPAGSGRNADIVYISGGTSISSKNVDNILGTNGAYKYTNTTVYLLLNQNSAYIEARYLSQIELDTDFPDELDAEIVVVDDPSDSTGTAEQVLALVVTAKDATGMSFFDTGSNAGEAIQLTLNNYAGSTLSSQTKVYLQAQTLQNEAVSYTVYQVPATYPYTDYSKVDMETAIYNGEIELVAQYEQDASGAWTMVAGDGATIVEDSAILLFAAAYYDGNKRPFLISSSNIIAWYIDEPSNAFDDIGWKDLDGTSMDGILNTATSSATPSTILPRGATEITGTNLQDSTKILEVMTDAYTGPETATIVFYTRLSPNHMAFDINKVEKEVESYLIAPQGNYIGDSYMTNASSVAIPGTTPPVYFPNFTALQNDPTYRRALEFEIWAVEVAGEDPYNYELYKLNILGEDTISIGETKDYQIIELYSNYTEDSTGGFVSSNVSDDVAFTPDNILEADPLTTNHEYDVEATNEGGSADALAGTTVDMVYSNGSGIDSATVTFTILPSTIDGIYIVVKDHLGYYFSDEPNLYNNASDILQLTSDLEIPVYEDDTEIHVLYQFSNEDFYAGMNAGQWIQYAVGTAPTSDTVVLSSTNPTAADPDSTTTGNNRPWTVQTDSTSGTTGLALLQAKYTPSATTVTIGSVTYDVSFTGNVTESVNVEVVDPLVYAVAANVWDYTSGATGAWLGVSVTDEDSATVDATAHNGTNYIVGETVQTDPIVYNKSGAPLGNIGPQLTTAAFTGEVTMVADPSSAVTIDPSDPYSAVVEGVEPRIELMYEYSYSLNGHDSTPVILEDGDLTATNPDTPEYEVRFETVAPEALEVYLVAGDHDKMTWHGTIDDDRPGTPGDDNTYTIPNVTGDTFKVYPVVVSSSILYDEDFLADWAAAEAATGSTLGADDVLRKVVDKADVDGSSDYYSKYLRYMNTDDFEISELPLLLDQNFGAVGRLIQTRGVESDGTVYYQFSIAGEVLPDAALQYEFDLDGLSGTGIELVTNSSGNVLSPNYSAIYSVGGQDFLLGANPDLSYYNLADKDSTFVVDLEAAITNPKSGANPYLYQSGETVSVEVKYYLSSEVYDTTNTAEIHPGYFGDHVLPGMNGYDATAANALRVEPLTTLPGAYSINYNYTTEEIEFTATIPGTYSFKLYTVNYANLVAPYASPQYREITFEIEPGTAAQTAYYGKEETINALVGATGIASIVEVGTSYLDATALSNGYLKLTQNVLGMGMPTVQVELRGATGNTIIYLTVTLVGANVSASLNETTAYATPKQMVDGETALLYWDVLYTPEDLSANYRGSEMVDANDWTNIYTENSGNELILDRYAVTVDAASTGRIAYRTSFDGVSAEFWVEIVSGSVPYDYVVSSSDIDINDVVTSLDVDAGVDTTLYIWDANTGSLVTGILLSDSSDTSVATVTDDGVAEFEISARSDGNATITVFPVGGGSVTIPVTVQPSVPTYEVDGLILDENGNPIEGALVTLVLSNGAIQYQATTGADGKYVIEKVVDGYYLVIASADGYEDATADVTVNGSNETVNITMMAKVAHSITVNVSENGTATADKETAFEFEVVAVTLTANFDYALGSITAKDADGNTINLRQIEGAYTFIMPDSDVTVDVVFEFRGHNCPSGPYTDINLTAWYHEYIDYVLDNGIMTGTSESPLLFEPNTSLSRAMIVEIFYNVAGRPSVDGLEIPFDDVAEDAWYLDALTWAYNNNVASGYSDSRFGGNDLLTREQMVQILYNYGEHKGYDLSASASLSGYSDANRVSSWATTAMRWAVAEGIITGRTTTTIVPQGTSTRAEVATVITHFCRLYEIF